jgi:hypothetical protein
MPGWCSLLSLCSTGVMLCEASVDTSPVRHTFSKFAAASSWRLWTYDSQVWICASWSPISGLCSETSPLAPFLRVCLRRQKSRSKLEYCRRIARVHGASSGFRSRDWLSADTSSIFGGAWI